LRRTGSGRIPAGGGPEYGARAFVRSDSAVGRSGAGEIPLQRFIPIAEENGLIHDLFAGVLRHACEAAVQWPEEVTLALDVYPGQMKDRSLRDAIVQVLDATGMPPFRLELEITESALVSNLDSAREVVGSLRGAGVRIVLDNFGTGYSSLYHLRNFRLDKIKIDRSFVDDLESVESARIVSALVGLAHGLGLTIVADGVRESGQRKSLLASGCEQGQGFLFSQAIAAGETLGLFALGAGTEQRRLSAV
jgi:EAL domain-containing protein (putative c-di-GMP-specific phosphodiesterase class I)